VIQPANPPESFSISQPGFGMTYWPNSARTSAPYEHSWASIKFV
jgi:hypothetical protein